MLMMMPMSMNNLEIKKWSDLWWCRTDKSQIYTSQGNINQFCVISLPSIFPDLFVSYSQALRKCV